MNLHNIPVTTLSEPEFSIGNLRALLAEIAALLENLTQDGTTGSIDLKSLPFAPGEYEQLRNLLGVGEVSAHIEAIGPSDIVETRYPGVWWVTHYNVEGDIVADLLEIAPIPEIIKCPPEGIKEGLALLHDQLKMGQPANEQQ